jgi:pyroglutamyl-peptidase
VPYAPQQVVDKPGQPALGIDEMATALVAGLRAIVESTDKPDGS